MKRTKAELKEEIANEQAKYYQHLIWGEPNLASMCQVSVRILVKEHNARFKKKLDLKKAIPV